MHTSSGETRRAIRFGVFEVDITGCELRKRNRRVKLQDLPFRLLVALLERPGEIVSREELRIRLWGDTVVDFDDGLHTAIRKLREVLGDSATNSRFIETVPRRGYRFLPIVSVESQAPSPALPETPTPIPVDAMPSAVSWSRYLWIAAVGLAVVAIPIVLANRNPTSSFMASDVIPITSYRGIQRSPALSPDGSQVAFIWSGESGDNLDVYIQNIDGTGRARLTTDPAPERHPAWSPDGKSVAFLRNGLLMAIPATGGRERRITTANGMGLSWSPDSKLIAVSDREGSDALHSIFLVSAEDGTRTRLTRASSRQDDLWPAFSPDGASLAFVRVATTLNDVYRISTSGGDPIRVALVGRPLSGVVWSPDGEYLFIATGAQAPGLFAVRASARDATQLQRVDIAGSDVYSPSVISRKDGRKLDLAFCHEISDWDIWGMALGDRASPVKLATSSRVDQAPSFSPDGKQLAFNSARSGYEEIWIARADGSMPRQLSHFNSGLASSPRWSPDGEWVVFDATIENNRDVYVASATGGVLKRITRSPSAEGQPSWSHDGKWLYFMSDRSGSQEIWKTPAGEEKPIQLTRNGGYQAFESVDGATVYYAKVRSGPGVWKVPAAGGSEVLVSEVARQNLWALNASGLYYFDLTDHLSQVFETPRPVPLRRLDLFTNQVSTIATVMTDLPRGSPALEVRGDGKYVSWVGRGEHRSELMLIRELTDSR